MRVTYHYEVLVCPREAYLITQYAQPSPADVHHKKIMEASYLQTFN